MLHYDLISLAVIGAAGIAQIWKGKPPTVAAVFALLLPLPVLLVRVSQPFIRDLESGLIAAASALTIWLSLITDCIALIAMRSDIRKRGQLHPILTAILVPTKLTALLALVLWVFYQVRESHVALNVARRVSYRWTESSAALLVASAPAILFSCFAFLVPLALALGRGSIFFLSRLIYAAQRFQLIGNKRLLWTNAAVLSAVSGYGLFGPTVAALIAGKPPA